MNLPAADVPHPRGLDAESTFTALRVLVGAPRCVGIVVTELNVDKDPGGAQTELLVEGLVNALGTREEGAE